MRSYCNKKEFSWSACLHRFQSICINLNRFPASRNNEKQIILNRVEVDLQAEINFKTDTNKNRHRRNPTESNGFVPNPTGSNGFQRMPMDFCEMGAPMGWFQGGGKGEGVGGTVNGLSVSQPGYPHKGGRRI